MLLIEADLTFLCLIIFLLSVYVLELLGVSVLCVAWITLQAQKAITPFILFGVSQLLAGDEVQSGSVEQLEGPVSSWSLTGTGSRSLA